MPDELGALIEEQLGARDSYRNIALLEWDDNVAHGLQHHAATGTLPVLPRWTPVRDLVWERWTGVVEENRLLTSREILELGDDLKNASTEDRREWIINIYSNDAYARLDLALTNPESVPADLYRAVLDVRGPQPNDPTLQKEWDREVANDLNLHTAYGTLPSRRRAVVVAADPEVEITPLTIRREPDRGIGL